jgi:ERCC4-type nuclease
MPPKTKKDTRKIWNEDLVTALRARQEQCQQQGSQRQFLWRDGANLIQEIRQDIYQFASSGKIVNLPSRKLTQTVDDEVRGIIQGSRPILPEGYIPTTRQEAELLPPNINPYDQDPYLKRIKMRGGAYAILLAFHYSHTKTLSKEQICAAAQPHCDEQMEPNWHAGRSHGAWSSKKTLLGHGLISEQKATTIRQAGATGGTGTYTLTDNGRRFTKALLNKFPQAQADGITSGPTTTMDNNITAIVTPGGASRSQPSSMTSSSAAPPMHPTTTTTTTISFHATPSTKKNSETMQKDRGELLDWIQSSTAMACRQRKFQVGASRREHLHTLCDDLMAQNPGLVLTRKTDGQGNQKALYICLASVPTITTTRRPLFLQHEKPPTHAKTETPPKKARVSATRETIQETGRGRLEESTNTLERRKPPPPMVKSESSMAAKKPAAARSLFSKTGAAPTDILDLLSDSSDDDDDFLFLPSQKTSFKQATTVSSRSLPKQGKEATSDCKPSAITRNGKQPTLVFSDSESDNEEDHLFQTKCQPTTTACATVTQPSIAEWPSDNDSSDSDQEEYRRQPAKGNVCRKQKKEKTIVKKEHKPVVLDLLQDDSPKPNKSVKQDPQASLIVILDDSSDEEDDLLLSHKPIIAHLKTDNNVMDILESYQESFATVACKTETPPLMASNNKLMILIDNRERNRNVTPREMRMELTRHMVSGSLHAVWPVQMPTGDVEEQQLTYGDFLFEIVKDGEHARTRLPVSVERKRVNDLVQRSASGDHWKQLQRMRDCCNHAIMLIEGDSRTTGRFTAFGSQNQEYWKPDHFTIDEEPLLFRFMGRAILSSSAIKFIQANDEQASYRAIGALGLVAAAHEKWGTNAPMDTASVSAKVEVNRLYLKLSSKGIPWQLARRVAEEVGSITHLDMLYANCDAKCQGQLLSPYISYMCCQEQESDDSKSLKEYGSIVDWSVAIHSAFTSSILPADCNMSALVDEYKFFVDADSRAKLLTALNTGKSPEAAVQQVVDSELDKDSPISSRSVSIEAPWELGSFLPEASEEAFYKLCITEKNPLGLQIPTIVMRTSDGQYGSARLFLHVLEAKELIERIQKAMKGTSRDFVGMARSAARAIDVDTTSAEVNVNKDRRVLVVRGLGAAIDAAAKRAGYRAELKVMVDMVFAELMIRHDMVVLQAVRLTTDLEMMVRELAMACFHYQLLTQPI